MRGFWTRNQFYRIRLKVVNPCIQVKVTVGGVDALEGEKPGAIAEFWKGRRIDAHADAVGVRIHQNRCACLRVTVIQMVFAHQRVGGQVGGAADKRHVPPSAIDQRRPGAATRRDGIAQISAHQKIRASARVPQVNCGTRTVGGGVGDVRHELLFGLKLRVYMSS